MPLRAEVRLNLKSFQRLKQVVTKDGKPVFRLVRVWIRIYQEWLWKRFQRFKKGGGNWPPLKDSTKRAKARAGYSTDILVRTGLLEQQFNPKSRPQILISRVAFSIRYGAGKSYPGGGSVEENIKRHNQGGGHLPKRVLLVNPDQQVVAEMVKAAEDEAQKQLDGQ